MKKDPKIDYIWPCPTQVWTSSEFFHFKGPNENALAVNESLYFLKPYKNYWIESLCAPFFKSVFFQKVRFGFLNLQISKKKYSKKLSWAWNSNFPPITLYCYWRKNLNFKFRIVFWNIFLEIWRFEKHIALSEKKPPLV